MRSYQVIKLILTGFVVVQENIKPEVLEVQTEYAHNISIAGCITQYK